MLWSGDAWGADGLDCQVRVFDDREGGVRKVLL